MHLHQHQRHLSFSCIGQPHRPQNKFHRQVSLMEQFPSVLTRVMVGGLILRDTFSRPLCPLVQPSMNNTAEEILQIPDFGKDLCPPIYPLGDQQWRRNDSDPLMSLHSLWFFPSVSPPRAHHKL